MGLNFYKNRVCLNVLTQSVENAKQINESLEGFVALGLLSANYETIEDAINDMKLYQKEVDNNISVGLGQGDPSKWRRVAEISKVINPKHINQVFSAVGFTRGSIGNEEPFINSLVSPSGKVGFVKINTGELSSMEEDAIVPVETAIEMIKEMGGNSIKFFPMKGLACKDELIEVARACAKHDFALEPTGGIDLNNFEEILEIIVEQGVQKIIPHVYTSIVDKETGLTNIEDCKKLFEIVKKVLN